MEQIIEFFNNDKIIKMEKIIEIINNDKITDTIADDLYIDNIEDYDIVKHLIDNKIPIPENILFYLHEDHERYIDIATLLLNNGININYLKDCRSLLRYKTNVEIITFLISKGININYRNDKGRSILFNCYRNMFDKNTSIIDLYISHKLNINDIDIYGRNVSFYQFSNYDLILKYNINVNIKDINNDTPLHHALEIFNFVNNDYFRSMLKHIYVNEQNNEGNTFLHIICIRHSKKILEFENFYYLSKILICEHNANSHIENYDGLTPCDLIHTISFIEDEDYDYSEHIKELYELYSRVFSKTKSSSKN